MTDVVYRQQHAGRRQEMQMRMEPVAVELAGAVLENLVTSHNARRAMTTFNGKPMAKQVPVSQIEPHLGSIQGWLDDDDPFFAVVDDIVKARSDHFSRILQYSDE